MPLAGLKIVERKSISDERGAFARLFCADELNEAGWHRPVAQINHSHTLERGTIRGMHYQVPPFAEMKLVTCIAGAILDCAVDLRRGSATFLEHHAEALTADNRRALLIPPGFAHGFQTLTDTVSLVYVHSAAYVPGAEGGLNAFDPRLGIKWPLPASRVSDRDREFSFIPDEYEGLVL